MSRVTSRLVCSPRHAGLFAVLGLLASAGAAACTSQHNAGASISLVIDAWDDAEPDKRISAWKWNGNAGFLLDCPSREIIAFDITSAMPTLEFVRNVNVDGEIYPAFGLRSHPRSPLLVFRHWAGASTGNSVPTPVDPRTVTIARTDAFASSTRSSHVQIAAVSRGGIMQPVPSTLLGTVSRVAPLYPTFVKTDTFSVTAILKVPTCTFADTPVALREISAADLPAAGRTAGERDFNVVMDCNGQFPVTMKLTDANAAGNTSSRLTATSNTTAAGVRVQLLREGTPVVLGQTWSIAQSQMGNQNIALSARYYREAGTFHSGVVEGQAVIEATYR